MTNQEAIAYLKSWKKVNEDACNNLDPLGTVVVSVRNDIDALGLAIAALEKQESTKPQLDRDAVFRRCISTYGADAQIDMVLEEMSELAKALLKYRRARGETLNGYQNIVDELADVKIMIRQMEIIFDCERDVENRIGFKLQRQSKRMDEMGE